MAAAKLQRLPVISLTGSFFCLIGITSFSNPFSHVILAGVFFVLMLIFLISLGLLISTGKTSPRKKYQVVVISTFIVLGLMFRSSQSLSWLDALILILTIWGVIFYINRRFY